MCILSIILGSGIKGNGKITTETRPTNQYFKSIEIRNGINVIIEQSENKSITIKVDDNLQQHIITKIENGILKTESNKDYSSTTPIVNVKIPIINGLITNSCSEITSTGTLITENIKVKSSDGSEINNKLPRGRSPEVLM